MRGHEVTPCGWCRYKFGAGPDQNSADGSSLCDISWAGFRQFASSVLTDDADHSKEIQDRADGARSQSARLLLGPSSRFVFNLFVKHLQRQASCPASDDAMWPNKDTLRQALGAVSSFRGSANPSRFTMRKLSRFFTDYLAGQARASGSGL